MGNDFDPKRMTTTAQASFHKALDLIRLSVAYHRLGVSPHAPDRDPHQYMRCPQCAYDRAVTPMDDGLGICPVCDTEMVWED